MPKAFSVKTKSVFIDTNIIIDYTKGHDQSLGHLLKLQQNQKLNLCINPVIIAEFFTDQNLNNPAKLKQAKEFFRFFQCLNIDSSIGQITAEILRNYQSTLGDSLIAATCLAHHLPLVTQNIKHFQTIKGLSFYL
jgi:predicted nucleic acid-binding protein